MQHHKHRRRHAERLSRELKKNGAYWGFATQPAGSSLLSLSSSTDTALFQLWVKSESASGSFKNLEVHSCPIVSRVSFFGLGYSWISILIELRAIYFCTAIITITKFVIKVFISMKFYLRIGVLDGNLGFKLFLNHLYEWHQKRSGMMDGCISSKCYIYPVMKG